MSSKIFIIAKNEINVLFREKTFILLLSIFILMTVAASLIGLSARSTIQNVYTETVNQLQLAHASQIPLNPFLNISTLSVLKNMIIYIMLIGALTAIVVGFNSFIRERKSGVLKLIHTKDLDRKQYILGKLLGISLSICILILFSLILNIFELYLLNHFTLTFNEIFKLFLFYLISLVYLLIFSFLGLYFAVKSNTESKALLMPVIIWSIITFMLPQITSGTSPIASLNPVTIQASIPSTTLFEFTHSFIKPFSISETYKNISSHLLVNTTINSMSLLYGLIFMSFLLIFLGILSYKALKNFNITNETIYA